jgi:F0F1-type ATP synthase assembly protein I
MTQSDKNGRNAINTILVVMFQVGVVTLVIILLSVFGGLWLDKHFGTKSLFTAIFVIGGMPVTIVVMYQIARRTVARISKKSETNSTES